MPKLCNLPRSKKGQLTRKRGPCLTVSPNQEVLNFELHFSSPTTPPPPDVKDNSTPAMAESNAKVSQPKVPTGRTDVTVEGTSEELFHTPNLND